MVPGILGLLVVAAAAVIVTALSVSRRLRRVQRAEGAAVVPRCALRPPGGWRCQRSRRVHLPGLSPMTTAC